MLNMSFLPPGGCATTGRGLNPLFSVKAAVLFTLDTYKLKSYPKYYLHSRPPSRAGMN